MLKKNRCLTYLQSGRAGRSKYDYYLFSFQDGIHYYPPHCCTGRVLKHALTLCLRQKLLKACLICYVYTNYKNDYLLEYWWND
jgi:hypothetical protein